MLTRTGDSARSVTEWGSGADIGTTMLPAGRKILDASIVLRAAVRPAGPVVPSLPSKVPSAFCPAQAVLLLCYRNDMPVRKKRSISIPPDLDAEIAAAAEAAGMSYSAWVAETARKEFTIRAGLAAVSQYEAEHGGFTSAEIAEADEWAAQAIQAAGARRTA